MRISEKKTEYIIKTNVRTTRYLDNCRFYERLHVVARKGSSGKIYSSEGETARDNYRVIVYYSRLTYIINASWLPGRERTTRRRKSSETRSARVWL